jgi:hypothetical protein
VPVLLLAQGDVMSKDMLRRAIEARYGLRPPALESLRIDFKGRARAKLGPLATWVPVDATAYFNFPTSMRWDFAVRAVGVQIGSGVEAFDGVNYRSVRGSKAASVIANPDSISISAWTTRSILWKWSVSTRILINSKNSHCVCPTSKAWSMK